MTCGPEHQYKLRYELGIGGARANGVKRETINPEQEHHLRKELRRTKEALNQALESLSEKLNIGSFFQRMMTEPMPQSPAWVVKSKPGRQECLPTAFLSDTHFGEVVRPEEVEWMNAYDREIAADRLQRFFNNTVVLSRQYLSGMNYPGIIMPQGGDMFSGDIHEELVKTNEGSVIQEVLYWIDPMISGLKLLADEFGHVFSPCVVGNHPRTTKKPSVKMRVPNNFDWLFYCLLKKIIDGDSKYKNKIQFNISPSADVHYTAYNTRYLLTHGDQFRGGGGIAGLLSPLMIGDARKRKRSVRQGKPYDYLVHGHWHQRVMFKGIIGNGSLKGVDEYSFISNFDYEPPEQSFWLTHPEHGITISAPIHVMGENESWMK